MPDLGSISAAIATVKTSMDIAKTIKDSNTSLTEAETKLKIAELVSSLADIKFELAEVQDLVREKDQEIRKLRKELDKRASLTFDGKLYWKKDDKTPFCPICKERDEKYHHLNYNEGYPGTYDYEGQEPYYDCKVCGNNF